MLQWLIELFLVFDETVGPSGFAMKDEHSSCGRYECSKYSTNYESRRAGPACRPAGCQPSRGVPLRCICRVVGRQAWPHFYRCARLSGSQLDRVMNQFYERCYGRCLLSLVNCSQTSRFKASPSSSTARSQFHTHHLTPYLLFICSCSEDCAEVNPSRSDRILLNHTQLCSSTQPRRSYLFNVESIFVFPVEDDGGETISNRASSLDCVNLLEHTQ